MKRMYGLLVCILLCFFMMSCTGSGSTSSQPTNKPDSQATVPIVQPTSAPTPLDDKAQLLDKAIQDFYKNDFTAESLTAFCTSIKQQKILDYDVLLVYTLPGASGLDYAWVAAYLYYNRGNDTEMDSFKSRYASDAYHILRIMSGHPKFPADVQSYTGMVFYSNHKTDASGNTNIVDTSISMDFTPNGWNRINQDEFAGQLEKDQSQLVKNAYIYCFTGFTNDIMGSNYSGIDMTQTDLGNGTSVGKVVTVDANK